MKRKCQQYELQQKYKDKTFNNNKNRAKKKQRRN